MGYELIPADMLGGVPSTQIAADNDELSGGIVSSFAILGMRTSKWRIKYKGDEQLLKNEQTGDNVSSVEVVIVKSSPHLSKLYYAGGYTEGSTEKPDCSSANGASPDSTVQAPVSPACGICPMNAFGSKVTPDGKQAKACSDHKRLAVVPLGDMGNEVYGGPMLLRIPASSLGNLSVYAKALQQAGFAYYGVGTRLRFEDDPSYPKVIYGAIRKLTDDELAYIESLRTDPLVARILNETPELSDATAQASASAGLFEQPPDPAPTPAPAPRPAPRPAPAAAAAPAARMTPVPRPAAPAPAPVAIAPPQPTPVPAPRPTATRTAPTSAIRAAVAAPVPRAPVAAPKVAPPAPIAHEEAEEAPDAFADALDAELDALAL